MLIHLLKPELEELIAASDWGSLKDVLVDVPSEDLAEFLEEIADDQALMVFRLLKKKQAAEVFANLSGSKGVALLDRFTNGQIRELMGNLSPDDRTYFVEELPGNLVQRVLNSMSPEDQAEVKQLLGYPEGSIGRIMTTKYVRVFKNWTVEQSLEHIRRWAKTAETINVIYVVDDEERLIDELQITQLILALPSQTIETLMDEHFVALSATEDQEEAVRSLQKYDRVALPVVDSEGVLVGLVTVDDILDVAEEETTEDMQKMAAMQALDDYYSETTIFEMVKKRIGWLAVLFIGQILTATALESYESVLTGAVFLSIFIPMIISSGGNSGSQAATLIIRSLATNDVKMSDWFSVFRRELLSGLILGGIIAVLGFGVTLFWGFAFNDGISKTLFYTAGAVSLSLLCVVLYGNLLGSMLPFGLQKLGLDPAVTSAPFVSTLSDVVGILIYFSIAVTLLKGVIF
jgi:magnesium transporter